LGFGIFGPAIVNDILKAIGVLHIPFLSSYGFLVFIIFQANILSRRFSSGFEIAENLGDDITFPDFINEEDKETIRNFEIKIYLKSNATVMSWSKSGQT